MLKPIRRELSKNKLDRVDKGRLEVAKGEGSRMGVSTNLGTKVNRGKRAVRLDPNIMEDVSPEGSNERDQVGVEVGDVWEETEEVLFDKFFLRDPKFLTAVIYNGVLIRVIVNGEGAGRSSKEVGKEVSYRYL